MSGLRKGYAKNMANKRMFTMKIVDSDAFLDMPLSAQCLYFHLNMRADDDGFVDNYNRIMKMIGSSPDDFRLLVARKFILTFDTGIIVIKHWRMHNTLSSGRYHETQYLDEKSSLLLKDNNSYSFNSGKPIDDSRFIEMYAESKRRTSGEQTENADKNRIDKKREDEGLEKDREEYTTIPTEPSYSKDNAHKYGEYGWVKLTDKQHEKLLADLGEEELKRCITYVDEAAQSTSNKNKWKDWNLVIRRCHRDGWGLNKNNSNAHKDVRRENLEAWLKNSENDADVVESSGEFVDVEGFTI